MMISKIENAIDRFIGIFSPRAEFKRRSARQLIQRQYAAAKATRLNDWVPANQDINSIIRSSRPILLARTRQLVRDFPYFNKAINVLTNYTVGTGIRFQSKVETDGEYNKRLATQIEDAVEWAMEELDISGRLHGSELERLAKRQDIEAGEFLFRKIIINKPGRYIPYALMPIEPEWLTTVYATPLAGNELDQGIEYDPTTGRAVAYHLAIPQGIGKNIKTERVPAEQILHGFQCLRPGQLRGISPFVTAILIAYSLDDYMNAEIDTARLAARYLAFVRSPDIATFQGLRTETKDNKKIESIENAIIEYLQPGEDIILAQSNRPGGNFEPFVKFVLRMVAVATDVTYELLTSDYDAISYSNLRGIRNDFAATIKPHSQRHILHFTKPVVEDIITYAVASGRLNLPGFWQNPRVYFKGTYTPPGMESIDPLRETSAWIDAIRAGLRSPQEIAAARGRDYEEIINEIAEAKRLAEEKGLSWEALYGIKTPLQTNPANLTGPESQSDKQKIWRETYEQSWLP
jgi:lambda family phage portal protein